VTGEKSENPRIEIWKGERGQFACMVEEVLPRTQKGKKKKNTPARRERRTLSCSCPTECSLKLPVQTVQTKCKDLLRRRTETNILCPAEEKGKKDKLRSRIQLLTKSNEVAWALSNEGREKGRNSAGTQRRTPCKNRGWTEKSQKRPKLSGLFKNGTSSIRKRPSPRRDDGRGLIRGRGGDPISGGRFQSPLKK